MKIVAHVQGLDDEQRFFTAKEMKRVLDPADKAWWKTAKPGDMLRVVNGGYFPGADFIIIKIGRISRRRI